MKNFISENITFLVKKGRHTQDDFGLIFDLKKGVINQYILGKSNPKIDTIQRICEHFKISIDDFINTDLSENKGVLTGVKTSIKTDNNTKDIAKEIEVRDELIAMYKDKIEALTKEINKEETLSRIEQKIDQTNIIFKELEEHFEYLNLKENLEKAKSLKGQKK